MGRWVSDKNTSSTGAFSFIDKKYVEVGFILIIFISAFLIRAYGIADNGVTWDEEITVNAAAGYINYIQNFVFDGQAWHVNYEHPPVGKYIYGIAVWLFGGGVLDGRWVSFNDIILGKWASALMGVATCILVYLICREFFDRWVGLASALILAFTPVFLAHTQIAALESPLAFFFTLTMLFFMLMLKTGSRTYFIISAILLGVLLDVKFNAILIIPIIIIFYLLYRHSHMPVKRKIKKHKGESKDEIYRNPLIEKIKIYFPPLPILIFCLIALVVWFVLWPWLWFGTISRLSLSLEHWTYLPWEHFLGTGYGIKPLYYYPVYFLVTTPLLLFIPLFVGLYKAVTSQDAFKYAIVLWFLVPFIYGVSSFIQGGMRYIIMIYPAMAILCGYGLSVIGGWASRLNVLRSARTIVTLFLTVLMVTYLMVSVLSVRPYYLDYYNSLAGGGQNIENHNLFNMGWWGEGIYEAEKYVDSIASPDATTYIITDPADPHHKKYNLHSQFLQVNISDEYTMDNIRKYLHPEDPDQVWGNENNSSWKPDYIIINHYMEEYFNVTADPAYYKLIYSVSVEGAPLAKVYKVSF